MSVRSRRPYSTPKRTTKRKIKDNKLDVTTRIRVDEIRLNDSDSLDTSFLEGRVERQSRKNNKKVSEKILKDNSDRIRKLNIIKRLFFTITLVLCIIFLIILLINFIKKIDIPKPNNNSKELTEKEDKKLIDDNYLFVGDFNTDKFDFEKFDLDYHYVKKGNKNLTTGELYDDLNHYVYVFNPSLVFLEIGLFDLVDEKSNDEIIENYEKIIDSIKENRPYAEIYVESIYPIDRDNDDFDSDFIKNDVDNDDIKGLNSKLKKLAKDKKVTYIDIFSALENNGKLDKEYTDNGYYLNEDGYKQVYKYISKYTKENS